MTDELRDADAVRTALDAAARAVVRDDEPVPAWQPPASGIPSRPSAPPERRPWISPRLVPLLAAAVVVLAVGVVATVVASSRSSESPVDPPPAPTTVVTTPTTAPTSDNPVTTAPSTSVSTTTTTSTTSTTVAVPPFELGSQPLWPFADRAAAAAWEQQHATNGSDAWHLDAGATALAFTRDYLGFTEMDRVTSTEIEGSDAHIGIGYLNPDNRVSTAAVLHLVRFGPDANAPWEVVGSRDTTLTLDTPKYGSVATSPMTVGGVLDGVDEALHITVRQLSSPTPIGENCCMPAGGMDTPWQVTVTYSGATAPVLTVAVATGGHVQDVERFAITGIRTRA
jgi:hypothetical protein